MAAAVKALTSFLLLWTAHRQSFNNGVAQKADGISDYDLVKLGIESFQAGALIFEGSAFGQE